MSKALDTKYKIVLEQERSMARAVAGSLIQPKPISVWEVMIPVIFILNFVKTKQSREIFIQNHLFTKIICLQLFPAFSLLQIYKLNYIIMKTRNIIFIGILALAITGCFVKSLHPFYKESDVVFKNELLGTWLDEDSATWRINPFIFTKGFMKGDSTDNSYLVECH